MTTVVTVKLGGRDVTVADPATYPYGRGCFDDREPITDRWEQFGDGCTVVDVGASFGAYTLSALARGCSVVAIEPSDDGWDTLVENVSLNPWLDYRLERCICWDGETPFPSEMADTVLTRDYPTKLGTTGVHTLDELLASESRVDAIKVDVEGAELGVLHGAVETLRQYHPTLLIEDHEDAADDHPICNYCRRVDSRRHITELLKSMGYRLTWIPMEPRRMYLIAEAT